MSLVRFLADCSTRVREEGKSEAEMGSTRILILMLILHRLSNDV